MQTLAALLSTLALAAPSQETLYLRAQYRDPAQDPAAVVDRIVDELLTRGEAYSKLRALCATAPHRLSGSDGAQVAVEWARQTMVADGLENVRLEPCQVTHWERGKVEQLSVTSPPEHAGKLLPILALGGSVATSLVGVEGPLVVVESFEELRELGDAARGAIVLFNRPMEDRLDNTFKAYAGAVDQRVNGASEAARVGAVAAIVRSMTMARDDVPHTGGMRYSPDVHRIPTAAVSTNGADLLAALVEAGKEVRLKLRLDCRSLPPADSYNVVGELVGREKPEEVVVVAGHLDSWDVGEGAHGDGAGCVQAMEVLRVRKALDLRPRRTLRCVLYMNEENGLGGAQAYYADHKAEMDSHVLAIESDRGGFTPRGFAAAAVPEAMQRLRKYTGLLARTGVSFVIPGGGGADIGPMRASGVPLVGFVPDAQRYFDLHHSANDVLSAVHPRELHLGASAVPEGSGDQ